MIRRAISSILPIIVFVQAHASFADHLKKVEGSRVASSEIQGIDYIYLINLDKRPEKWERSLLQLNPYKIAPHRFSAIYGWDLSAKAMNDLGVKYVAGMKISEVAVHFPFGAKVLGLFEQLSRASQGKVFFSKSMTPGAIGCTLSHLSVLQDALDAGYETIWVIEDDILVEKDPHHLHTLIEKLDHLVGKEGWDILYTDHDREDRDMYPAGNDFESDLKGDLWYFWRPDRDLQKEKPRLARREILSEDFLRIGSRMRTHSMVIRRSGMQKILDFYKRSHMFIPYDHELAIIPDIKLISLRHNVVTHGLSPSDTKVRFFPDVRH